MKNFNYLLKIKLCRHKMTMQIILTFTMTARGTVDIKF